MRGVWFFIAAGSALVLASRLLGPAGADGPAAFSLPRALRSLIREHPLQPKRLRSCIKKKELLIGWV